MTSYEPSRRKAYCDEVRWRMVYQCEGLGYSKSVVAKNLGVNKSTVSRIVNRFLTTGSVTKNVYPKERAFRKLTSPAQHFILNHVLEKPGIYLRELQKDLLDQLLLDIDVSTICRFLHESNFRYQKLSVVSLQRDVLCRQKYINDVSLYNPDMFIFVDETGSDIRNSVRRYGYSLRGMPLEYPTMFVRGERTSAIAMMSIRGILDVYVTQGTTNGDTFCRFIENCVLPQLQPFDGVRPHSVLVMDNCSIHHVQEVQELLDGVGAMLHFLPPYSPDLNPIELAFSKVKTGIKELDASFPSTDVDIIMLKAFGNISQQDCQNWIAHSSVYNVMS